ncbi:MAG: threonine/serine exporter family protein [bacterium]|nr:threonine/serine exporter family protein [bacterium]
MSLIQTIAVFVATASFALVLGVPKRALVFCASIGTLGYIVSKLAIFLGISATGGVFLAASTVGVISEVLARSLKMPATVFITAGIIPLAPGAMAYYAMLYFSKGAHLEALSATLGVVYIASAISAGLILGTLLRRR